MKNYPLGKEYKIQNELFHVYWLYQYVWDSPSELKGLSKYFSDMKEEIL